MNVRRLVASTALSIGALASTPVYGGAPAASTSRAETGFALGLRLGWGLPLGSRVRLLLVDQPMGPGGEFSGLVPFWFDAGYRVSRLLYLGGYFQYGFLLVPSGTTGCPAPLVGCHAHDLRGGANVHLHFMSERAISPWLGAGLGYEASSITFEGSAQSSTRTNGGFEIVNLQAGVDVSSSSIAWGPFVSFSFDEYITETQTLPDGSSKTYSLSGPNSQPTLHYFAIIGMRGQFDF